jgi:hypothetical protein
MTTKLRTPGIRCVCCWRAELPRVLPALTASKAAELTGEAVGPKAPRYLPRGLPAGVRTYQIMSVPTSHLAIVPWLLCSLTALAHEAPTADHLAAENAQLRSRVQELEAQVTQLNGLLGRAEDEKKVIAQRNVALEADAAPLLATSRDAVTNATVISCELMKLEITYGRSRHHWFQLRCVRKDGGSAPPTIDITFKTAGSGGIYRNVTHLQLDYGDAASACPVTSYDALRRGAVGAKGRRGVRRVGAVRSHDRRGKRRRADGKAGTDTIPFYASSAPRGKDAVAPGGRGAGRRAVMDWPGSGGSG